MDTETLQWFVTQNGIGVKYDLAKWHLQNSAHIYLEYAVIFKK